MEFGRHETGCNIPGKRTIADYRHGFPLRFWGGGLPGLSLVSWTGMLGAERNVFRRHHEEKLLFRCNVNWLCMFFSGAALFLEQAAGIILRDRTKKGGLTSNDPEFRS